MQAPHEPCAPLRAALETPNQADVIELIAELDRYQTALYPPQSNHLLDLASLQQPNVLFVVARVADGGAAGCAAVVLSPPCGELKRMIVRAPFRQRGVAKAMLMLLESEASKAGCTLLQLETGIHQHDAIGLYERAGYQRCGPFGDYVDDPLSVFMLKRLDALEGQSR